MKPALYLTVILFSFSLCAQVIRPKKVTRPSTKAKTGILDPASTNSLKIIRSGVLNARNGGWCYTTTTLPDGKVLVAWSSNYPKGEATFHTPTLTPYAPVIYTKNNYRGGAAFSQQESVTFANGNVLLVYFEQYELSANKSGLRLMYVTFDKNGKLLRPPSKVDFIPKSRNSLSSLHIGTGPGRAYVYFTEYYREAFSNGANDNYDTYFFATNESGKILQPVKKVLSGYNTFAPRSVTVSRDPVGGLFMGHKTRDLFVEHFMNPGSLDNHWKVQVTRNIYDLGLVAVHGVKDRKAIIIYTEGKTAFRTNNRLVCRVVGEDGPGEKIAISDGPVNSFQTASLSLKDGSIFISVADGTGKGYKATGWIIDQEGAVMKGPFQFIDNFKYKPENFDMTQLINGQIFVVYQGMDNKPRYVVVN